MSVPFTNTPSNLRVPLFFAEIDPSRANTAPRAQRSLLIGQKTALGNFGSNVPQPVVSTTTARAAAGPGSVLANMIDAYRANDPNGELWVLPLDDAGGGVAATGTIAITGTSSAAGTLALYVAGQLLALPLASGTTAAQAATIVAAAINANVDLPVTASANAGNVTVTADNKGETGNDIDIRLNYRGWAAGELVPAGLSVVITAMSGGATNPSLTTGLAALLDQEFDFIACALTDSTALTALAGLLSDTSGRWAWSTQVYGHAWIAKRGTAGTLASFAAAINNQHVSCIGFNDSPSPPWVWAAATMGAAAVSLRGDPGLPLQFLTVAGVVPPPLASRFPLSIRNSTLLYSGVSTWTVDVSGAVVVENVITTYLTNAQGRADNSYLQVETLYTLAYVLRSLRDRVLTTFGRKKLAVNGTRLLPGSNVVTPNTIRADLIAGYRELEAAGFVQNSAAFARDLIVEIDDRNPNRVNVLWPGTLIGQLRTFALLAQFRLQ